MASCLGNLGISGLEALVPRGEYFHKKHNNDLLK
jgi:hypothetical protein